MVAIPQFGPWCIVSAHFGGESPVQKQQGAKGNRTSLSSKSLGCALYGHTPPHSPPPLCVPSRGRGAAPVPTLLYLPESGRATAHPSHVRISPREGHEKVSLGPERRSWAWTPLHAPPRVKKSTDRPHPLLSGPARSLCSLDTDPFSATRVPISQNCCHRSLRTQQQQ